MSRILKIASICFLLTTLAYGQQSSSQLLGLGRTEWEYLVISFGKTYFGSPSKTSLYSALLLQNGQEGTSLQANLDGIGKLGWELVAVVGAIGGDQQLILKRKRDPAIEKKEADYLQKETAKIMSQRLAQYKKEAEDATANEKLAAEGKILIDLDVVDQHAKSLQEQSDADSYIQALLDGIDAQFLIKKEKNLVGLHYTIRLQFDLTENELREKNQYRKSSIDSYLSATLNTLSIDDETLWIYDLEIIAEGYLKFNGKLHKVAEQTRENTLMDRLSFRTD